MDHSVYEMSSERAIRYKDPGASIGEVVSTNHRQSRQSWLPLMAIDRGLRMLFVREPTPRETGTIDVEVSFRFDWFPLHGYQDREFQIAVHTETNVDTSSLHEVSQVHAKNAKLEAIPWTQNSMYFERVSR